MSDTSTAVTTDTAASTDTGKETDAPDTGAPDLTAEVEKWKTQARKHEERAKANAKAASELEAVRQQHMTEQEKAVAAAKAEGRAEGLATGTAKVAKAEIRAAAAGRLSADQLSTLLETINLAAFIGEDGEVDEAKVTKFVDGIAPPADEDPLTQRFPDLGQGARGNGKTLPLNGDPLERDLKAKLGIR